MKKMIMGVAILFTMLLMTTQTDAQSRYSNKNAHQKIQQGVKHGKLTRVETHRLRSEQARITQMKRIAMADGFVSPKERQMIVNAERRANRNIYYQKHDRQNRF